jgi:hypothetical protein
MKQVWMISVAVLVLAVMAGGGYYFWNHSRPVPLTEEQLKNVLPVAAGQFLKCIDTEQIGSCYFEMTTADFRHATNAQQMAAINQAVKIKLGERISGALIEDTFTMRQTADQPPRPAAEFNMAAIYENDATVKENFIFVFDPTSNSYKVHVFRIRSTKF